MVTLTFHNNSIIRFNGYYVPVNNLSLGDIYSSNDAISAFKQHFNILNDSCDYYVTKKVAYNPNTNQAHLCFQVLCSDANFYNKILYVSTNDLSIVRENELPGSGFNATFYTQYNGMRSGYNTCLPWTPPTYVLNDPNAAVEVLDLYPNVSDLRAYFEGVTNTFYNSSNIWGYNTQNIYPNYILDAYWSASEYSYYMQNTFNVPKGIFQRYWFQNQYVIDDTLTPILIASNTFADSIFWRHLFYNQNKGPVYPTCRNIIVIGAPGIAYLPKASIDETVHEFAHIFSYQCWNNHNHLPNNYDNALAEACADIWAAIITSLFYPNDEGKIWKIGEDIVLPSSGKSCVRNLANPNDNTAVIQMFSNNCQSTDGSAYEQSGVISHWFYLLTHGFSGSGCDGMCYNFPAIPLDSAAKLLYYCETSTFYNNMEYPDICQATANATVNFSDPESILTSVLGAWNVLGVKPLDYGIEQFGLSYTSTNSGTYTIDKNLVVESPNTLTVSGTLRLGDTCKIIVRPGGKLVVDGGTLTSACPSEMWQGVEVVGDRTKQQLSQYQGKVELMNGATIENALCGIRTGLSSDVNFATTGGIIFASEAIFLNNCRAVEINSYAYPVPGTAVTDYVSNFNRCSFTVDSNNLFAPNYTAFTEHVKLWDVKGVDFYGCTFENLTNGNTNKGRGIYADDAGVIVETYCTRPLYENECECPDTLATYGSFSGFNTAIEVNTTGNPYAVRVNETDFENNGTGVKINGNNYVTVINNNFNLQKIPRLSANQYGLYLDNCTGYWVEGNTFVKSSNSNYPTSTGIYVNNSGSATNSLYRNDFSHLYYGIYLSGKSGGLSMSCGSFDNNTYGIYIASRAIVAPIQGSSSKGADISFPTVLTSSIYNAGPNTITYYYGVTGTHYPTNYVNIIPVPTKNENTCSPTPCNALPNPGPGPADGLAGEMTSDTYHAAVRAIMADSLLDLSALERWHAAAQPIGDPYSLTETRFMMGYNEPFVADADDAELANYAEFHAMKVSLRGQYDNTDNQDNIDSQNSPMINWYALTPAQIAQLQTIAERNAGRASVMAKGVLCFFHGICYEDEDFASDDNTQSETKALHSARSAESQSDDHALAVHPNPTDGLLTVELSNGAGIANAVLYDLQGRLVETCHGASLQGATATLSLNSVPAGVYVLRVTDTEGREYHQKIVKK